MISPNVFVAAPEWATGCVKLDVYLDGNVFVSGTTVRCQLCDHLAREVPQAATGLVVLVSLVVLKANPYSEFTEAT
jgi:hypothetical protein